MRILIMLAISVFFVASNTSCESTKTNSNDKALAYFVRHAEKADDGSKDPPLTDAGRTRARKLADMLEDKNIKSIYSTEFDRTKSTAKDLADRLNLAIQIYNPSDTNFLSIIRDDLSRGSLLVVGHSNTTPALVNKMIEEEKYEKIEESDYGNIYLVEKKGRQFTSRVNAF